MANEQLPNDVVRTFHNALTALNAAGQPVPVPVGSTYSVVVSDPTAVEIIINAPDFTARAIGPNAVGLTAIFSEQGGPPEASATWTFDTVDDVVPAAVGLNTLTFTDVPQPVPVAPTPTPTPPPGP